MFSSCPLWALIAGVKIGCGRASLSRSPAGRGIPQAVPSRRYSLQADPAR